ncbi:MAG: hypothetical protein CSA97_03400 [Bacteroidetes bacterium]|nr:MAG: hypothetical protein CSA97_03400 [Bacteroidota bacterium]
MKRYSQSSRYSLRGLFALLLITSLASLGHAAENAESTKVAPDEVPNIITPNGDGINDQFVLHSSKGAHMVFSLFTRDGSLVYTGEGAHIVFDGLNDRGDELSAGTYFYTLEDASDTYEEKHGVLYISRGKMKDLGQ